MASIRSRDHKVKMMSNLSIKPPHTGAQVSARSQRSSYRGHPAKDPASCLQCYSRLPKGSSILCPACTKAALEQHRGTLGTIRAAMGSLCSHGACSAPSIGVLDGWGPYCEGHIREARAYDFTGRHAFVSYSSISAIVQHLGGK